MRRTERTINPNQNEIILRLGSKALKVGFLRSSDSPDSSKVTVFATTRLDRIAPRWKRRHHETRRLFVAAQAEMQKVAREEGHPVEHIFTTRSQKMIAFALGPGREIFNWDNEEPVRYEGTFTRKQIFHQK